MDSSQPYYQGGETPFVFPIDTNGHSVMELKTRKDFLDDGIKTWMEWHTYRALAIVFFIVAIISFQYSILLSAVFALIAGKAYGEHLKKNTMLNTIMKLKKMVVTR